MKKRLLSLLLCTVMVLSMVLTAPPAAWAADDEHTFGEWYLSVAPSSENNGSVSRKCSHCEETETSDLIRIWPELVNGGYWWSTQAGKYNTVLTDQANSKYFFATTPRFTRETLPTGSVIMIESGWQYRPEGWVTDAVQPAASRPDNCTTATVMVTEEWWGDFTLRGFNIAAKGGKTDITGYTEDQIHEIFRIYVPAESHTHTFSEWSLSATPSSENDGSVSRTCTSCRMTETSNLIRIWPELVKEGYWWSVDAERYNTIVTDLYTSRFYFATTPRFTRETLPTGSVIMLESGWQYRPEGWVTDTVQPSASRPANCTTATVMVTDKWWGDFTLRGFNITIKGGQTAIASYSKEDIHEIFRIYVPENSHIHSYESVVTAPTCSKDGYTTYTCRLCRNSYIADEVASSGKHAFGEWYLSAVPSAQVTGVLRRDCADCDAFEMETLECTHTSQYSWDVDGDNTLEILAIGNSFSVDALQYAWQIAHDLGIENIVIGNLYIGGCSLETHATNAAGDLAKYTYYHNDDGTWSSTSSYKISTALKERSWDYISMQQRSNDSGLGNTYNEDLTDLIAYVKKVICDPDNDNRNPCTKLVWHMTWAYQQNSTHTAFSNYNKDQMTMYNGIVSAVQNRISTNEYFDLIVPSGTAVQNARTSLVGDTLTRDGYHMSYGYGRYLTGLMFIKTITGMPVDDISYRPSGVSELYRDIAVESVNHASTQPFAVTQSEYTGEEPDEGYRLLRLELTAGGYWESTNSKGKYNTIITDADNSKFFFATPRFTKEDLPVGSIIMLESGWQYRPEGWITDTKQASRPDTTVAPYIIVTDEWWGNYTLRGFNIAVEGGTTDISGYTKDQIRENFRIYIPVEPGDKTELQKAVDDAKALTEADYTTASWADVEDAVAAAEAVLADVDALQPAIDSAKTALEDAVAALIERGDKTELQAAVDAAKALSEADYTTATWADVEDAIADAETVLADVDALQPAIDAAEKALEDTVAALVERGDKAELQKAVNDAKALTEADYTTASWADVEDAVAAAEAVLADVDALQPAIDSAKTALEDAVAALVERGDKTELQATVDTAKALTKADYTTATWADVEDAIAAAETVFADVDALQPAIAAAEKALEDAVAALIERGDKTELQKTVNAANALDEDDYTAASWKKVKNALADAEIVLEDVDATKDDIDTAKKALADAIAALTASSPETGDTATLGLWMVMLILSAAGCVILSANKKSKKSAR